MTELVVIATGLLRDPDSALKRNIKPSGLSGRLFIGPTFPLQASLAGRINL